MTDDCASEAWTDAREQLAEKHAACLEVIAATYGHGLADTPAGVRSAVAAAMRAGYDVGVEYTHRKDTIPPPPPSDHTLDAERVLALSVPRLPSAPAVPRVKLSQ